MVLAAGAVSGTSVALAGGGHGHLRVLTLLAGVRLEHREAARAITVLHAVEGGGSVTVASTSAGRGSNWGSFGGASFFTIITGVTPHALAIFEGNKRPGSGGDVGVHRAGINRLVGLNLEEVFDTISIAAFNSVKNATHAGITADISASLNSSGHGGSVACNSLDLCLNKFFGAFTDESAGVNRVATRDVVGLEGLDGCSATHGGLGLTAKTGNTGGLLQWNFGHNIEKSAFTELGLLVGFGVNGGSKHAVGLGELDQHRSGFLGLFVSAH